MKITKKSWILLGSMASSFLLLVWDYIGNVKLCSLNSVLNRDCMHFISDVEVSLLLPIFSLTLMSLITFWMRDAVFQAWFRFTRWWIPLSVLLALVTPESGGGGFGPSISFGKPDVALIMSVIYVLASIVIIVKALYRKS